jgi:hypothetical protein
VAALALADVLGRLLRVLARQRGGAAVAAQVLEQVAPGRAHAGDERRDAVAEVVDPGQDHGASPVSWRNAGWTWP